MSVLPGFSQYFPKAPVLGILELGEYLVLPDGRENLGT